jgi:hypothetical protein
MSLAELQRRFFAEIVTERADRPASAGVAVYRNAYRARLIEALRGTYPRVHAWLGDAAFDAAAAHHAILHPPQGWTIDAAGDGFAETLAALYRADPEVEELAWLDAGLATALVAADEGALTPASFAACVADYDDLAWTNLRLRLAATLTWRPIRTNVARLWSALSDGGDVPALDLPDGVAALAVWRDGLVPRFRALDAHESRALAGLAAGDSFGAVCDMLASELDPDTVAGRAGAMLGRWVGDGMVAAVI